MKKNRRVSKKRLTRRRKKKLKSRRRSLQAWLAWAAAEAQRQALAALVNGLKTLSNSGRTLVIEDGLNMSCSLNLDKIGRPSWEVSGGQEYPRYSRLQAHWLPPRIAGAEATLQRLGGWSLTMDYPVQRHASSLPPLPGGTASHQATCLPSFQLTLIQTPDPQNIAPQRPTADCTLWKQPVASVVVFTFSGAINRPPPLPEPERPLPQKIGVDWTLLDLGNLGLYQGQIPGTFIIDCNDPEAKQLPCNDKKGSPRHKFVRTRKYCQEAIGLGQITKRFRKAGGYIGKSYRPHRKLFSPKNRGSVKNRRQGYHKPRGYGPQTHRLSRAVSKELLRELQAANSTDYSSDCFTLISPAPVSMRQKPSLENCLAEAPEKPAVVASNDSSEGQLSLDDKKAATWHEFREARKYYKEAIGLRQTTQQTSFSSHQLQNDPNLEQLLDDDQKEEKRVHRKVTFNKIYYLKEAIGLGQTTQQTSFNSYPSPAAVQCDCRDQSQDVFDYCYDCMSVKELSSWLSARLLEAKQRVLNEGLGVLDGCFRGLSSIPTEEYSYWPRLNREGRQKRAIWHKGLTELTVFGQQLQAMAGSLAQEEAWAVTLLNDSPELPQEVTSTLTPPCQDLSTERPGAKEILRELPVLMPQFKQDVLNYGRGVFEEEFLALRQILATYEQPGLNQEDLAIKEILLEVATEMIAFDQQLQAFVPSPLPAQGVGLQDSSVRPTEFNRLSQEIAAFQEQAVGFHNRREMPRVTVTPSLPTLSQELGNPVNT